MAQPKPKLSRYHPQRESDERILTWLKWRIDGYTPRDIAEHVGTTEMTVRAATNKARTHDIIHSDEPKSVIQGAYW